MRSPRLWTHNTGYPSRYIRYSLLLSLFPSVFFKGKTQFFSLCIKNGQWTSITSARHTECSQMKRRDEIVVCTKYVLLSSSLPQCTMHFQSRSQSGSPSVTLRRRDPSSNPIQSNALKSKPVGGPNDHISYHHIYTLRSLPGINIICDASPSTFERQCHAYEPKPKAALSPKHVGRC